MRPNFKAVPTTAVLITLFLLMAVGLSSAQQQVNLTAGPANLTLPDGSAVPMWGYSCGTLVGGSTATCAKLNPTATGWSPVVVTVPTGQDLQINLTNNLSFGATPNKIPTSLVIVGQLGAGLGTTATSTPSPDHSTAQQTTWPIANPGATGTPPAQGPRVQSFSTEVAAGTTTSLTWKAPRPGTYLIESGTHPSIQGPMGLYGMLVVTSAPVGVTAGTAYPGATYNADVPLLLSEIDPVQNNAVQTAVNTAGFSETAVWSGQPGGCGNPSSPTYNTCYPPAVNYTPLYYLFNGVAFDKTHSSASLFPASPASGVTGSVLVRFVNAGLRMHVPSIVGSQTGASAVAGFSLIAEDGNPLPGVPRVQSEVFMAAGKTYDVMVNVPAAGAPALPVYDRELSLSGNSIGRDAGMLAYIGINGSTLPAAPALAAAVANPDSYSVVPGNTLTVSDPAKGVMANDTNVYGVKVSTPPTKGSLTLNANGTFTYVPNSGWSSPDTFVYQANGSGPTATVTLTAATIEAGSGIVMNNITYTSNVATSLSIKSPGVLSVDKDSAGYPLTVAASTVAPASGLTLSVDKNGGFNATVSAPGTYTFTYKAQNSQGTVSSSAATVTLIFPSPTNLAVTVLDGKDKTTSITDYRWIIEEDRTFYVNPNTTTNTGTAIVPTFGTNFHTSYMPVVAQGCVGPTGAVACETGQTVLDNNPFLADGKTANPNFGKHVPAVCDIGNGVCRTDASQQTPVDPSQVHLDPTKRYYISILPGDAANPFIAGNATATCASDGSDCGHGMGGAPIAAGQTAVTVLVEPTPLQTAKLSVFVFEDDFPLNGEQDAGGGVDVLSPNEPGLGQFNITLFDDAGGTGDATGQMTYDMFNMPLSNSLDGTIDPATGKNACPISKSSAGITGTIVTCPKFESDGTTLSPLAGQAVVANLMPGRYGVVATPGADRIARGEEWLQTNTLDGQKAHDSFLRVGEPSYFQEFGPAGYHVSIGFANPAIINGRLTGVCNGTDPNVSGTNCKNSVTAVVTTERMSRTPDERLYSSGSNDSFAFTQCYASIGDPDGEDFAFTKCDGTGKFTLSGLPDGDWRITVFDQWNDMLVDGLSTPVRLAGGKLLDMGQIAMNQWQANIYTRTFLDTHGDGVSHDDDPGLSLVATNIRFRDGSFSNFNNTDLSGNAGFNEVFPLFSWYVVETDTTRYKNTGTHVVYDAGGPADGTPGGGTSTIAQFMANTVEPASVALPTNLRVPGAVYCSNADCTGFSIANGPGSSATGSTGRIDPPWVLTEGWQGFSGQNSFLEFGKAPFAAGENGGIKGHVVYASTRPFDDPQLLLQTSWEPLVPGVTINLYQEGTAPDGTQSLTLVDTTKTSSWDDWAQGFRSDGVPDMNCPGQSTTDLFYFSLFNQPNYLDAYNNGGTPLHTLPNNSQFKCYDGMHNWNQLQPAPYDGFYQFPSIIGRNPTSGVPTGTGTAVKSTGGSVPGTNCTICVANPTDSTPMLPTGKYVVEVVVPPNYELVKEEDKNILIGDNYIAPVTQQFGALGSIFILPDQAAVGSTYNANNAQNPTQNLGRTSLPSHEGDTGSVETFWPCVGASRIVPDYISLFPQSGEVAPFAGATRNLCDRKEVTLDDQTSALAKFYIFTSTHAAAHFTGVITDDFTSEFDPFSPQFGEKFAPPDLPISIKDWSGNEIARTYTDHWGAYDGLNYSTWEVNPPNPTGYAPTMMVVCMNDPGTGPTPDPLYNPSYSQFCYEIPFMPGQTQYMDTPVVPTSAFAGAGYNNADCSYPDATPAISEVDGDGIGPYVSASGHTLTIKALGDQVVNNYGYSGPSATAAPFNQKTVTRHYGFGGTTGTVTIGGVSAAVTGWSDTQITVSVPSTVPACAVQQQQQYGGPNPGSPARCGQLVITAANGKQSIDAVTVTVGGKAPTRLASGSTIQSAIDAASPGDLIIVPPGTYNEMVLMWKPVRLQGVGAPSSIINANTHPAGKLDPWRRQVDCLFGLALNGTPISNSNPYDATNAFTCTKAMNFAVDRLPLEATVGWDATLNGNLAELLQEPTLMGAYEGAGITVLGKGVDYHGANPYAADTFPTGTTLLTASNCGHGNGVGNGAANPFPSNFQCNPSRIDGLSITDSSQGGGGIFAHAWNHNLEISNNRVHGNTGTLAGGISVGQGEFPPSYAVGSATNAAPGSCQNGSYTNQQLPYCFNLNVSLHNNAVTLNSSIGDELFSATPSGPGGVAFCNGSDYYKFNYNWVCGNMSTGDGGGLAQLGYSWNGDIEHNSILFNQSLNPTIPTYGGGIVIHGTPDVDPTCGTTTDADCAAPGMSDGTGPGLVINANLIQGNAAESGSGGGIRFQNVNGTDVATFPTRPDRWYSVNVTNNIISNNVAGWDGAGVSLQDALAVNFINNTVISNDTTASSGVLFNTLGAPVGAFPGPPVAGQTTTTGSAPQPAGLVAIGNSPPLLAALAALPAGTRVTCPAGHFTGSATNGTCTKVSYPLLTNNVFWQNRAFYIGVGPLGTGTQNQQNVVTLYDAFGTTPAPSQPQADATTANGGGTIITGGTGACVPGTSYWDIGVRGDAGPTNHGSGFTLAPTYSVLTDASDYPGAHNTGSNPTVLSQYCNGSRVPPEFGSAGYQVPPGISDATVPNPVFSLTPAATVDEGNNWINMTWGPLSLLNPVSGTALGNFAPASTSSVINLIPSSAGNAYTLAPSTDFFGNLRKTNNAVDAGAVEFVAAANTPIGSVTGGPLSFGNVVVGTTSTAQTLTLHNTGTANLTGITVVVTAPFSRAGGTCGATLTPAAGTCTITVVFSPTAQAPATGSVTITANVTVTGSPVSLTGTGIAPPAKPTLTVLDNFNRGAANNLGSNWDQLTLLGFASIRIVDATTGNTSTGVANANSAGNAYWTTAFGTKQAAAFTIANTTLNGDSLLLDGTGSTILGVQNNFIRVRYNGGSVFVETTTTFGLSYTTAATFTGTTFVNGDTITAMVDATGTVYVWRTTAANVTTYLGGVQLGAPWTGGGRIGMQLPSGARVDNFAGGNVP